MGSRKVHVLIVGSVHIPSYKIGILQPFRMLKDQGVCSIETKSEEEMTRDSISGADVILFIRCVRPETYKCLERAHELGIKTVYSIDDQFLAMSGTTQLARHYSDESIRTTFTRFLKNAQIVKVDAPFFAQHIRTHFHPKSVVCFPASVDFDFLDKLRKPKADHGPIVIGYEGGEKDIAFSPVIPALERILREYKDKVRIEFMGYIPSTLKGRRNVTYLPGQEDYHKYLKRFYQRGWDIGLAPLEDTLFHHCKTNNKFREYAACRVPGIYSASPAYMDSVTHEENGLFTAQTRAGWYTRIKQMIENPKLRADIRDNSEKFAKEHFAVEACADHWRKQILHC